MKRAMLVALGTGALITSAAAVNLGTAARKMNTLELPEGFDRARIQASAREAHRERIEARYQALRSKCEAVKFGARRDDCYIAAHAFRGRALLESHAPYARS
jgi:hypothetical protein